MSGKMVLGMSNAQTGRDGEALSAVAFHAREGEHAGHLSSAADEQSHGAAMLTANVNLAFEDEDHVGDRSALFEQDVSHVSEVLLTMAGEPEAVFEGQPVGRPMRSTASAISSTGVGEEGVVTAGESIRWPPRCSFRIADLQAEDLWRGEMTAARENDALCFRPVGLDLAG